MLDMIALILAIVGGLNWGLIGIFQFDLVAWLFGGQDALLSRIVYTLVGAAAVWCLTLFFRKNDKQNAATLYNIWSSAKGSVLLAESKNRERKYAPGTVVISSFLYGTARAC